MEYLLVIAVCTMDMCNTSSIAVYDSHESCRDVSVVLNNVLNEDAAAGCRPVDREEKKNIAF